MGTKTDETWSTGFPREIEEKVRQIARGDFTFQVNDGPMLRGFKHPDSLIPQPRPYRKGERGFICLPLIPLLFAGLFGAALASDKKTVIVEKHVTGCRCDACSK